MKMRRRALSWRHHRYRAIVYEVAGAGALCGVLKASGIPPGPHACIPYISTNCTSPAFPLTPISIPAHIDPCPVPIYLLSCAAKLAVLPAQIRSAPAAPRVHDAGGAAPYYQAAAAHDSRIGTSGPGRPDCFPRDTLFFIAEATQGSGVAWVGIRTAFGVLGTTRLGASPWVHCSP